MDRNLTARLSVAIAVIACVLACGEVDPLESATVGPDAEESVETPADEEPAPADLEQPGVEVTPPPAEPTPPPVEPTPPPAEQAPPPVEQTPPPAEPTPPAAPTAQPPPANAKAIDALPTCTKPIIASFTVAEMQMTGAGSDSYLVPGAGRLTAMDSSITSFLNGDGAGAITYAGAAEYTLCRGTGAEADLVLWKPAPGEGQAWIALRTVGARPAIFEAPHPIFDSGTLEQAAHLFDHLKGRVLIASGTHRCASSQSSGCSGTTAVCGSNAPYRISDMAHTEQSVFQTAHVAFSDFFAQDWVLSMHGMAASGASISNGTTQSTTAETPSARVALEYAKHFSGVTTCNAFSGVPSRDHLCGTTTSQGRSLNGSANACTSGASSASGRFIHVEQNKSVRSDLVKTAAAINAVLP